MNALKAFQKPAAAAVLVGLLLMCDPNSALAASGGRMGGSSFSSRSSKSSSQSSMSSSRSSMSSLRDYTTPRMESGSGFSNSVHAPSSRSSMSSSRDYTTPRMESGSGFSYSVHAPSPLGGVYVLPAVDEPNFFLVLTFVIAAHVLVIGGFFYYKSSVLRATEKTSVLKLQVGLLGLGWSPQKGLNRIAETADTSTSKGLHYVLTETVLLLLRHPDYCISAFSSVDVKRSVEEGEKRFNQLSIEERGKFDEETHVNVNNIKKQSSTILRTSGFSNKYIVITILVAAEGEHKLPSINSSKDLKDALQKLASIPSRRTMAVEVLWTRQNEDDTLIRTRIAGRLPVIAASLRDGKRVEILYAIYLFEYSIFIYQLIIILKLYIFIYNFS